MSNTKGSQQRRHSIAVYLVIALIGAILIIVPVVQRMETASSLLLNVGTEMVGAAVVFFVLFFLLRGQAEIVQESRLLQEEIDAKIGAMEAMIKAADSLREESRKVQEDEREFLRQKIDALVTINDNLYKELDRVEKKQDQLEKNVRKAIDVGINDINSRLREVTVSEILDQLPSKFRSDLEEEINTASERVIDHLVHKLKQSPDDLIDEEAINIIVRKTVRSVLRPTYVDPRLQEEIEYCIRNERPIPRRLWEEYTNRYHPWYDDRFADLVARRVAVYIRERYW